MILKCFFWIFLSIAFCLGVHSFFIYLTNIYTYKKVKYLGVVENIKYQQIINELKKKNVQLEENLKLNDNITNIDKDDPVLTLEINEMKNSLIEIMLNS